jgi:hypothetical protein
MSMFQYNMTFFIERSEAVLLVAARVLHDVDNPDWPPPHVLTAVQLHAEPHVKAATM